jgi:hypothetical protein
LQSPASLEPSAQRISKKFCPNTKVTTTSGSREVCKMSAFKLGDPDLMINCGKYLSLPKHEDRL